MKKVLSVMLTVALIMTYIPVISVFADSVVEIFDNSGVQIVEKIYITEYRSEQLSALTPVTNEDGTVGGAQIDTSNGKYVTWESNLPLLADVDDTGKVTAYDFSKRAIIQLWIDENIMSIPLVGEATANAIWAAIDSSGIDVDNADTDTIVAIVSAVAGEQLGESLRKYLDNMNVVVTATLYDAQGNVLGSDSVEIVVEKSLIASVAPTGVHITNKKTVPTLVAVGAQVQLYGACTPVRLGQGVKWSVGKNAFDTSASNYASVSGDGLVTFLSAGEVTVRVNPESTAYATFSDKITFTVVEQSELPVESFDIVGSTSVGEGETIQLSIDNVVPEGAYRGDLAWSSADPTVAVVDENGNVTGLNGGDGLSYSNTVTVIATMGGVEKTVDIKVTRPVVSSLTSVEIEGNTVLGLGVTEKYISNVSPGRLNSSSSVKREWGVYDGDAGAAVYATSDSPVTDGIISVDYQGNVTAVSAGVGKLCAKATYGSGSVETSMEIVCGNAVTDFEITGTTTVSEGSTTALSVNVLAPEDYEVSLLNTIKWRVEDDSVAAVSADGVVLGRDAGGRNSSRTTTVYATISGVTRSVKVTVKRGLLSLSKFTDGQVEGDDYVIRDIPNSFTMKTYPTELTQSEVRWGLIRDDGSEPWSITANTVRNVNLENEFASVTDGGIVSGKKTGTTTLYGFSRYLLQTHIVRTKEIEIIEILPDSITLKAPDKLQYIEGETELDLTGMEVYLNYKKEALAPYYSNWESYTDDALRCSVTDYTVSRINTKILDAPQYIIVSVERAGDVFNAVFTITLNSKQLDTITVTPPEKTEYAQGEEFDPTGLTVVANYLNTESEEVEDYEIDWNSFSMETYDVEQNVRVVYEHAGRSAEATFPITVYGKPVISVSTDSVTGEWTAEDIVLNLDSTHQLDGATYYWRESDGEVWNRVDGNVLTFDSDFDGVIHIKAVNSKGYESDESEPIEIKIDKAYPQFTLKQGVTTVTNKDYAVGIKNLTWGISGIKSVALNGRELGADSRAFVVSVNGDYTVTVTANNGLSTSVTLTVDNIDKEAPGITDIQLIQEPADAPERHTDVEFGNYYSGKIVAIATAEDSGVAGVDYIKYRLVSADYTPLTSWVVLTEETRAVCENNLKGYFEFVAVDKVGNTSSSYYSDGFVLDNVKPVITTLDSVCGEDGEKEYVSGEWADDMVFITPHADAFSGIYKYYYNVDGGEWTELTTKTIRVKDDGAYRYGFKVESYSGLESDVYEIDVKIDRTVPAIKVDFEGVAGQWTKDNATFTLSTHAQSVSGCTYYYNDGTGWHKIDGNVLVLDKSTNAEYTFKAVNGAGLESAPSGSYKIMIDNIQPTAEIIAGVTEKTDAPYDIAIVPRVGESGYLKIYFNGEDVTQSLKATVSKNGSYALTVIGNNMLSSTVMVEITNFSAIPAALFTYSTIDEDTAKITAYNGSGANITVPMEIDGYEIKSLSDDVFLNKTTVISVNIPVTVESVGDSCFSGCEKLNKVVIPYSVTSISENAFDGCGEVTIYCYKDSYAHTFAQERGIPFVLLDLTPVGKTVINEDASVIFTYQSLKNAVEEIVKADSSYTVMAIPSTVLAGKNYYGTGSMIYFFRNGSLVYTYNVVVYGDVNGDSAVDVIDLAMIQSASTQKTELEGNYLLAADFGNKGLVDTTDYQQAINIAMR